MQKVCAAVVLLAAGGTVLASPIYGVYSSYNILDSESLTFTSLDQVAANPANALVAGPVYSNMNSGPNGYVAFPAATGVLGFDDYDSINDAPIVMDSFQFVGGVSTVGGIMFVDFFDAGGVFVDGFGVALPSAGNFIWTISLAGTVTVADAGLVQMTADAATTGLWFLGDGGPTIGSEDVFNGGGGDGQFSHNFAINAVPTPGTAALLGLGGLIGFRRRR
jgi:uncharacterized protein (TIGR03382 family)